MVRYSNHVRGIILHTKQAKRPLPAWFEYLTMTSLYHKKFKRGFPGLISHPDGKIRITVALCFIMLFLAFALKSNAQGPIKPPPIVIGPGDTAVFALPPKGFDTPRENIARGTTDTVEYYSKSVGNKRKMLVYTPPGYDKHKQYPVLYLLHGIGGDEKEWFKYAAPNVVLDNLMADGKLTPMIVVFPNGRAQPEDRPVGNVYATAPAFANFVNDLLGSIMPFIAANYRIKTGSKNTAIAGFSMGGGQSLNIGLTHPETFAWVGGFSSAPNTKSPEELVPDAAKLTKQLRLLYLSCGDKDGLIFISQRMNKYLSDHQVPHIWQVNSGGHNMEVWIKDLYFFSQRIFK